MCKRHRGVKGLNGVQAQQCHLNSAPDGALVSLIVFTFANSNDQHDQSLVNRLVNQPVTQITQLDFVGVL